VYEPQQMPTASFNRVVTGSVPGFEFVCRKMRFEMERSRHGLSLFYFRGRRLGFGMRHHRLRAVFRIRGTK
jgi:hypothetical protein